MMDTKTFKKWLAATLTKLPKNRYHAMMPSRWYFDGPGVNSSIMKMPRPAMMKHRIFYPMKETYEMLLGTLTHKAILEPDKFDMRDGVEECFQYAETDGLNTKKAAAQRLADPTRPVVTEDMVTKARRLRDAVFRKPLADRLLNVKRETELSGIAWNEESQINQKIRIDQYPLDANYLLDVKNVPDLDENEVWKVVKKRGYHISAALQLDTDQLITGAENPRPLFYLVCIEGPTGANDSVDQHPYCADVFEIATMQPSLMEEGRNIYKSRLAMFANAARTDTWEAFEHDEVKYLSANPPWRK